MSLRVDTNARVEGTRACGLALLALALFTLPVPVAFAEDVSADFVTGSGFSAIGQIGTYVKPISLALALFWAVWGIVAEGRAFSAENGDWASLGAAVIRGAFLPVLVGVVILVLS